MSYQDHPACYLPKLSDTEFESLKADIKTNGLNIPIKIYDGLILDGRHRYRACLELGVEPRFEDVPKTEDPYLYVKSSALHRQFKNNIQKYFWMKKLIKDSEDFQSKLRKIKEDGNKAKSEAAKTKQRKSDGTYDAQSTNGSERTVCGSDTPDDQIPVKQPSSKSDSHPTRNATAVATGVSAADVAKGDALENKAPDLFEAVGAGTITPASAAQEARKRENQIKIAEAAKTALPSNVTLYEGDIFEQIKNIKDKSVDLLITDPPYGVMSDYEWDAKDSAFLHHWLNAVKGKLNDKYSGFIFCDSRKLYEFESVIREHFEIKNKIIWVRKNMAKGRVVKDRFISSYEVVFYFGTRPLNLSVEWSEERFDSCEYAVPQSNFKEGKFHPTQKPLGLFERLIKVGSYDGDTVLDCFAGSGTTGIACKNIKNRKCVLIEKEPEYIQIIKGRING